MPTSPPAAAILRTLLYAAVQATGVGSPRLLAHTERVQGYVMLRSRQALALLRAARRQASATLWPAARRWAAVPGCLPLVRKVAVPGALAADNSAEGGDIDLPIVTAPGRVWPARAVGVVRVARAAWVVGRCPNHVLAETALAQERRDLFVAQFVSHLAVWPNKDFVLRAVSRQPLSAWRPPG